MNDIVERLRAYAKNQDGWSNVDETCEQAADEIERLSARLAEVERERDEWIERAISFDLPKELQDRNGRLYEANKRCEAATARAERLAAALRPLVEACESDFTSEATEDGVGRERDDEPVSFTIGGIGCDLTFGHIRAGRAALATPEPQG